MEIEQQKNLTTTWLNSIFNGIENITRKMEITNE